MAVLAVGVAGAVAGGAVATLGLGAAITSTVATTAIGIGFSAGTIIGNYLFGPKPTGAEDQYFEGPRLESLIMRGGSYGADIPEVWGSARVGGAVIWKDKLREDKVTVVTGGGGGGGGGGGKGGKGGGGASAAASTSVQFKYYGSFAVVFCEGPANIQRIWLNSQLAWDLSGAGAEGLLGQYVTVYTGDGAQLPDARMEAAEGVGNVPAYRGVCYAVFDDLPLEDFGNSIPNVEAEVCRGASTQCLITGKTKVRDLPDVGFPWGTTNNASLADTQIVHYSRLRTFQSDPDVYKYEYKRFVHGTSGNLLGETPFFELFTGSEAINSDGVFADQRHVIGGGIFQGDNVFILDLSTGFLFEKNAGTLTAPSWFYEFDIHRRSGGPWLVDPSSDLYGYFLYDADAIPYQWSFRLFTMSIIQGVMVVTEINESPVPFPEGWIPAGNRTLGVLQPLDGRIFAFYTGAQNGFLYQLALNPVDFSILITDYWKLQSPTADMRNAYVTGNCVLSYNWTATGNPHHTLFELDYEDSAGGTLFQKMQLDSGTSEGESWAPAGIFHVVQFRGGGSEFPHSLQKLDGVKLCTDTVPIAQIIEDVCADVDISSGDIDTSSITEEIGGFVRTGTMAARSVLAPLVNVRRFDVVESSGVLRFQAVDDPGVDTGLTITEDYLDVHPFGAEGAGEAFTLRRIQSVDTPREVRVSFSERERDYDTGLHRAFDPVSLSRSVLDIRLPAVLSAQQAKEIAQRFLNVSEPERVSVAFSLGYRHLALEPGDVLSLESVARGVWKLRITRVSVSPTGVLSCEGVLYDRDSHLQAADADTGKPPATLPVIVPSDALLLDIPAVRLEDTSSTGIYAAGFPLAPPAGQWPGADLYHGTMLGWLLGTFWSAGMQATYGVVDTPLGTVEHPWAWDEVNELVVTLTSGSVSSSTDLDVQNGENRACVGVNGRWELIGFVNAQDLGNQQYRLTRLLRATRGTERFIGTGLAGDVFVLLDTAGVRRAVLPDETIGQSLDWVTVPAGSRIALESSRPFTHFGVDVTPFAPARIQGARDGITGDLRIVWTPRSRCAIEQLMGEDYGHCEAWERYEVELRPAGQPALLRTLVVDDVSAVTYGLAAYRADSGDPAASAIPTLDVTLYQMSARVGRGWPAQETL